MGKTASKAKKHANATKTRRAQAEAEQRRLDRELGKYRESEISHFSEKYQTDADTISFEGLDASTLLKLSSEKVSIKEYPFDCLPITNLIARIDNDDSYIDVRIRPERIPLGLSKNLYRYFRAKMKLDDKIARGESSEISTIVTHNTPANEKSFLYSVYVVSTKKRIPFVYYIYEAAEGGFGICADSMFLLNANTCDEETKHNLTRWICYLGLFIITVEQIIALYLSGKPLPKFDGPEPPPKTNSRKTHPTPNTTINTVAQPDDELKQAEERSSIAHIHFNPYAGSLSISSGRHFKKTWWIVCGHRRQYRTGTVSLVRPYIKGDRTDADAQAALEIFIKTQRKIQCFRAEKH